MREGRRTCAAGAGDLDHDAVRLVERVPGVVLARAREALLAPSGAPAVANNEVGRRIADNRNGVAAIGALLVVFAEVAVLLDVVPAGVDAKACQNRTVGSKPFPESPQLA